MRRRAVAGVLSVGLGLSALAACAKPRPLPPYAPEDYVFPTPAGELSARDAGELRKAWAEMLAGEVTRAARRLERLRGQPPPRASLDTALAYTSLRAGHLEEAGERFQAAVERWPEFVPALAGAGVVAARQGDLESAFALLRRAQAEAPADAALRTKTAALKLRAAEARLARAEGALRAGEPQAAAAEYRRALETAPELTSVRLALAELLADQGDAAGAVAALEADPAADRTLQLRLGRLLLETQQPEKALALYRGLLARDSSDAAARAGYAATRDALEAAAMPEEYRLIPSSPSVTRADLAALLIVRVKALRRLPPGEVRVAVDISGSWAREQIAGVLALGIMDVYPNHTFQPGATLRRLDAARAVARVLDLLGWPQASASAPNDLPRSHLDHDAVMRVLGAGVMGLSQTEGFEPWRPLSGREAIDTIESLARLVGP